MLSAMTQIKISQPDPTSQVQALTKNEMLAEAEPVGQKTFSKRKMMEISNVQRHGPNPLLKREAFAVKLRKETRRRIVDSES